MLIELPQANLSLFMRLKNHPTNWGLIINNLKVINVRNVTGAKKIKNQMRSSIIITKAIFIQIVCKNI